LLKEEYFAGAPDMVVEIVSRGGRQYDLKEKAANYRKHGVREYWVVDQTSTTLYRHTKPSTGDAPYLVQEWKAGRVASEVVPGFWIDAAWLWQDPLPEERTALDHILG
jgi:Uma2 family endonuclease